MRGQDAGHGPGQEFGRAICGRVDLDPVAGGQDHHLVDSWHGVQPGEHAALLGGGNGELLEHLGPSGPVGQADVHNRHRYDRSVWGVRLAGG